MDRTDWTTVDHWVYRVCVWFFGPALLFGLLLGEMGIIAVEFIWGCYLWVTALRWALRQDRKDRERDRFMRMFDDFQVLDEDPPTR